MAVDGLNRSVIRNTDMVGLDAHKLSVFLMGLVHGQITTAAATLIEKPEICKSSREGGRDRDKVQFEEIWNQVIEHNEDGNGVGGDEEREN